MRKMVNTIALIAIATSSSLTAGGNVRQVIEPIEVAQPELVVDEDIKYKGFYVGVGSGKMNMNEAVTTTGYTLSFIAGYYFNKYFGLESRYTRTVGHVDVDHGVNILSEEDVLRNMGIYFKPIFNLTTGFSFYGLAGYGEARYEKNQRVFLETGFQWGLGAKYELAEGFGLYIDYLDIYEDDNFDGINISDISFGSLNVGTTYTF